MTKFIDNTRFKPEVKKTEFTKYLGNEWRSAVLEPSRFTSVTFIGKFVLCGQTYDRFLAEDGSDYSMYLGTRGDEFRIGKVDDTEYIDEITDESELVKTTFNKWRHPMTGEIYTGDLSASIFDVVLYIGKDTKYGDSFLAFRTNSLYRIYYGVRGCEFDQPSAKTPTSSPTESKPKRPTTVPDDEIVDYLKNLFEHFSDISNK